MENLNEQSIRIKQLFTNERLYGNLVKESFHDVDGTPNSRIFLNEYRVISGKNLTLGSGLTKKLRNIHWVLDYDKGKDVFTLKVNRKYSLREKNSEVLLPTVQSIVEKTKEYVIDYQSNGKNLIKKELKFKPEDMVKKNILTFKIMGDHNKPIEPKEVENQSGKSTIPGSVEIEIKKDGGDWWLYGEADKIYGDGKGRNQQNDAGFSFKKGVLDTMVKILKKDFKMTTVTPEAIYITKVKGDKLKFKLEPTKFKK